MLNFGHSDPVI